MILEVRTPDKRASKLFEWDKQQSLLSIAHGENVLAFELTDNHDFVFREKDVKPKAKPPPPKKE